MLIEIERHSWENYLNIINFLCYGKKTHVSLLNSTKEGGNLNLDDKFLGLQPYLSTAPVPVLALVLGTKEKVNFGYFLKKPQKIWLDKGEKGVINQITVELEDHTQLVLNFDKLNIVSKPKSTVYHHRLSKSKKL